jgi:hypothetical protein
MNNYVQLAQNSSCVDEIPNNGTGQCCAYCWRFGGRCRRSTTHGYYCSDHYNFCSSFNGLQHKYDINSRFKDRFVTYSSHLSNLDKVIIDINKIVPESRMQTDALSNILINTNKARVNTLNYFKYDGDDLSLIDMLKDEAKLNIVEMYLIFKYTYIVRLSKQNYCFVGECSDKGHNTALVYNLNSLYLILSNFFKSDPLDYMNFSNLEELSHIIDTFRQGKTVIQNGLSRDRYGYINDLKTSGNPTFATIGLILENLKDTQF